MAFGVKNRQGFTLIEVLVVLVISAIVFAVLVSVLGSSFEILRTSESRAQLNANARTVLEYITDDIQSASYIPLATDRDRNGWDDGDVVHGYDRDALWRIAEAQGSEIHVYATYALSEAFSDQLMLVHSSEGFNAVTGGVNQGFTVPKLINNGVSSNVAEYTSLFRLAIPADQKMPYYLAGEWDRDGDGIVDPRNTGLIGGVVGTYPSVVAVGPHKETAAVIQDIFYKERGIPEPRRIRQIPIASNITRVKYEYFHEVPVYQSRAQGGNIEIACQDLTDGSVVWVPQDSDMGSFQDLAPMVSHWEQRIVDVGYNADFTDGPTGANYNGTDYYLFMQYPEEDDTVDLGRAPGFVTWNCSVFYNLPEDDPVNAPVDRLAFVSTGASGGQPVEGGIASLRYDADLLQGTQFSAFSQDPTGVGDLGDADGIPDGDGIPDDPVPGWWLPYVRSIRVTVVATPRQTIDARTAASGQAGRQGVPVYYRLDSPVPYADVNRTQPMYNWKADYVGSGDDLIVTKTVPVNFTYRLEPITAFDAPEVRDFNRRRAEINYFRGQRQIFSDPISPDQQVRARGPVEKLIEREPTLQ